MTTRTFALQVVAPSTGWVPGTGQIATVGLNTVDSQKPTASLPTGVMNAWCGAVFTETLGAQGSMLIYGGGDNDYLYNEVYRYDVATQLWSRMTDPCLPIYLYAGSYTDGTQNSVTVGPGYGEYWADTSGTSTVYGQLAADHTYGRTLWCPPGSFGNDPLGYYVVPQIITGSNAKNSSRYLHYLPLSQPKKNDGTAQANFGNWFRSTSQYPVLSGFGCSVYDPANNRVVMLHDGDFATTMYWMNCANFTVGTLNLTPVVFGKGLLVGQYGTAARDSATGFFMAAALNDATISNNAILQLVDPNTLQIKYAAISGSLPPVGKGGWDWVQSWGAWVYYEGGGEKVVWTLKKPASDPWNNPWVMSSQSLAFNGTPFIRSGGNQHISRFRYVPSAGCFIWAAATASPMQAFNVTAP